MVWYLRSPFDTTCLPSGDGQTSCEKLHNILTNALYAVIKSSIAFWKSCSWSAFANCYNGIFVQAGIGAGWRWWGNGFLAHNNAVTSSILITPSMFLRHIGHRLTFWQHSRQRQKWLHGSSTNSLLVDILNYIKTNIARPAPEGLTGVEFLELRQMLGTYCVETRGKEGDILSGKRKFINELYNMMLRSGEGTANKRQTFWNVYV